MPYLDTRLGEKAPAELRALHQEIEESAQHLSMRES